MKKILSFIFGIIICLSTIIGSTTITSATTALPTISSGKPLTTYTYNSSGKIYSYTDSTLKKQNKDIKINCSSDECKIIQIKNDAVKVKVNGNTGWFAREAFTYRDLADEQAKNKFTSKASVTTYKWKGKTSKLGSVDAGDKCYTLRGDEDSDWVQIIYPVSGGHKMGWVKGSDYDSMKNGIKVSAKIKSFINDDRWDVGTKWTGSQGPKLSTYDSSGCCAYAADFVKYVYGISNLRNGTKFTSVKEIKAGDVLYLTPTHWMVVVGRSGDNLDIIHGNWTDGKVCRNTYTLNGSKIGNKTFKYGYHYY